MVLFGLIYANDIKRRRRTRMGTIEDELLLAAHCFDGSEKRPLERHLVVVWGVGCMMY